MLQQSVDPSNVLKILAAADKLGAAETKKQALQLAAAHFTKIARSQDLSSLPQHLLVELMTVSLLSFGRPLIKLVNHLLSGLFPSA